jgi:spore maturation protein CgeB
VQTLERNLEALRRRDAALAERIDGWRPRDDVRLESARSGAPTLRAGGRLEASAFDPVAEGAELAQRFLAAARAAGARRLVLFGLGVHTLAALREYDGDVLVIEPSLDVARRVLEAVELGDALARFELVVSARADDALAHPQFRAASRGLFLAHAAAERRAPELCAVLRERFSPGGAASPLSIAVIPPLYGGTLPIALFCARALRELGHRVRELSLQHFLPAYQALNARRGDPRHAAVCEALSAALVRLVGEAIVAELTDDPPDLVFALAQAPLDPQALESLRALGCRRARWVCEDFRVIPSWKALAPHYERVFHVQPDGFPPALRAAGGSDAYLPMAFDPAVHRPESLSAEEHARYGADVSFVGAGYHNRVRLLPALADLGLRIWGTEWPRVPPFDGLMPEPNVRVSPETANKIYCASRVNLNLHSSPWCDGVNPVGDFVNPRTFELCGAGAFQLVDERRDLARHFRPGVELATFRDGAECRRQLEHYLARDDERRAIAAAGRARALAEHTYRHRMAEAIEDLRGARALAPRRRTAQTAGEALDLLEAQDALAPVLARLPRETQLDRAALDRALAAGEGALSRAEKLVMFMRESHDEVVWLNQVGQAG